MSGNGHEPDSVAQIKVFGVGGGGSNAVTRMHRDGMDAIEYMIVNTDAQALKGSDVPVKIRIGDHLTEGQGGGGNPEMGAMAAEESRVELHEAIRGVDMTFIAAGMGGGTGTGAAPVIAEMARECGALAVGVVTRPFAFEGAKRAEVAEQGIAELRTPSLRISRISTCWSRMVLAQSREARSVTFMLSSGYSLAYQSISRWFRGTPGVVSNSSGIPIVTSASW